MTLMEQVCEARDPPRRAEPRRSARRGGQPVPRSSTCRTPRRSATRYPHQVSGGQLQRAMAAMAMVARPDIVVFDEPTTALDVTTQVECLAAFRKLVREHGAAALYITHDLAVVAQIADRIMVLQARQDGRIRRRSRQILQDAEGGIHPAPRDASASPATPSSRSARTSDADPVDPERHRPLSGQAERHQRRQPRHPPRRHGGGGRRIGIGQVDARARRHRAVAARRGRCEIQRRRACRRASPSASATSSGACR